MTTAVLLRELVEGRSWTKDATCARKGVSVDLWSADNETARRVAIHVCLTHCPALARCAEESPTMAYQSLVAAGTMYDHKGQATKRKRQPCRCPLCRVDPAPWPHIIVGTEKPLDYRRWRDVPPCGTEAAHSRHRRRGEPIDEACREVARQRKAASKRRTRAQARGEAA